MGGVDRKTRVKKRIINPKGNKGNSMFRQLASKYTDRIIRTRTPKASTMVDEHLDPPEPSTPSGVVVEAEADAALTLSKLSEEDGPLLADGKKGSADDDSSLVDGKNVLTDEADGKKGPTDDGKDDDAKPEAEEIKDSTPSKASIGSLDSPEVIKRIESNKQLMSSFNNQIGLLKAKLKKRSEDQPKGEGADGQKKPADGVADKKQGSGKSDSDEGEKELEGTGTDVGDGNEKDPEETESDEDTDSEEKSKRKSLRDRSKRKVGSPSGSIKQMKDAIVRSQAVIAATKVATIQAMTMYATHKQAAKNPLCDTFLLNIDEIVPRPDKAREGARERERPMVTMLVPEGLDAKELGATLVKLGMAMQEPKKKRGGKKLERAFDFKLATSRDAYLVSIYGAGCLPVAKKTKTKD